MSRSPRRSFAAPLILSVAAIPACVVTSNKPANDPKTGETPEQRDHRGTGDDAGDGTKVIMNPPRPEAPQVYEQDQSWSVRMESDGSCKAYGSVDCPEASKCNPPRPSVVTCPEGISEGEAMDMWVSAGSTDCYVSFGGSSSCPKGATCNPPPPQKAECPQ